MLAATEVDPNNHSRRWDGPLASSQVRRVCPGFAARCEDVAVPFRVEALWDLGCALRFEITPGRSPTSRGTPLAEGQSHILTTGGEAVTKSFSEKQESKNLLRRER